MTAEENGQVVLREQLRRSEMAKFFAHLAPCLIGMEACGSSHLSTNCCQALTGNLYMRHR